MQIRFQYESIMREQMQIKSATDLRHALAEYDLTAAQVAREVGITTSHLNEMLHGRRPVYLQSAERIERVIARAASGEITREVLPRRKTRAEQLREEQLASGGPAYTRL